MILAMLTQFHRKDFITMTVCALGFYFLTYPETTRRSQFRMLVLLIGVSILQDVLWFVFNRDTEDDDDDGGVERSVKTFSRKVSYLSFAWRVSTNKSKVSRDLLFYFLSTIDLASPRPMERLLRLHRNCESKECGQRSDRLGGAGGTDHPRAPSEHGYGDGLVLTTVYIKMHIRLLP